jgi:hypothetical protein
MDDSVRLVEVTGKTAGGSDQDYLLGLFEAGLIPQSQSHDAAVPDGEFFDEVVYEA